jgi:hypothetical protein
VSLPRARVIAEHVPPMFTVALLGAAVSYQFAQRSTVGPLRG